MVEDSAKRLYCLWPGGKPGGLQKAHKLPLLQQAGSHPADLASVPETGEAFPACERMALLLLGVARGCKESLGMVNY